MSLRDDYFYCGYFECPGEHPIPGMTCPDEDSLPPGEPEDDSLPGWCPEPDTCTALEHLPPSVSRNPVYANQRTGENLDDYAQRMDDEDDPLR